MPASLRIATWNVLSGRAPGADHVDVELFAAAVTSLDADVLALQEVDRAQPRSGYVDLARVAADAMGATSHRFVAAMTGTPGGWRPAHDGDAPDGPAYGIALLSRLPVSSWRTVALPGLPVPVPFRWPGAVRPSLVRDEQRAGVAATVETGDGPLVVAATHLSFLGPSQGRQLRRLLRWSGPVDVLAGDLNLGPARATRTTGMRPLAAGPTFPVEAPTVQIDHLLAGSPRVSAVGGGVVRLPVSDHRALVVDVRVSR